MPDDDVGAPARPAHPTVPAGDTGGKLIQITDAPGGGVRVDDVRDPNSVRNSPPAT
jgi:hypothetical protein